MPIHRHECESCGNRYRVLVLPGVDSETPTCPVCGSTASHRLMPLVAVQFKGSGFYKTDHGSKGRARSGGGETDTESAETPGNSKAPPSSPKTSSEV